VFVSSVDDNDKRKEKLDGTKAMKEQQGKE